MAGDTIVLRITDRMSFKDSQNNKDDTTMYVLYNNINKKWVLRGRRQTNQDFSFYCTELSEVENFLNIIYNNYYQIIFKLCNFKNLPRANDEITYDLLDEKNNDKTSSIAVYDVFNTISVSEFSIFHKYLRILNNIYNQ